MAVTDGESPYEGHRADGVDGAGALGRVLVVDDAPTVSEVVEAHAGRADVRNVSGGCRFELTLPAPAG